MTAEEILNATAHKHGLSPKQLHRACSSPKRHAKARAEAMATVRCELGWSYEKIGRYFGGYHHSSVMHLIREFSNSGSRFIVSRQDRLPPTLPRGSRNSIDIEELRRRVEQLEQIVSSAGLMYVCRSVAREVAA